MSFNPNAFVDGVMNGFSLHIEPPSYESTIYSESTRAYLHNVYIIESRHKISNNVVYATSKGSDQPAHAHSLIRAFASRLNIK